MTAGIESQPRTVVVGARRRLVDVDLPLGEPLQHLVEGDPPLEASECRAEAVVRAVPERHVLADVAVDVEPVRVFETALVVVG